MHIFTPLMREQDLGLTTSQVKNNGCVCRREPSVSREPYPQAVRIFSHTEPNTGTPGNQQALTHADMRLTCILWQVHCWRCALQQGWTFRCHSCCHSCKDWACAPGRGCRGSASRRGSGTRSHCPRRSCKHDKNNVRPPPPPEGSPALWERRGAQKKPYGHDFCVQSRSR